MKRHEAIKLRQAIVQGTNSLPAEVALEVPELFKKWTVGEAVKVNEVRQDNGVLYKVIQAHTTQANWTPEQTPALWLKVQPAGVIADWVQPTGAHDAYNTGDKMKFNGQAYESVIDGNVYSPTAYPKGWKLI